MANQEHLDILKQGVVVWNKWREEYSDIQPDLSGADLSGSDLSRIDLRGTNLFEANLFEADLFEADLGTTIIKLDPDKSGSICRVNLSKSNLSKTLLTGANLSGANLIGANLIGADLIGANLTGANLSEANLSDTDLGGVYFIRTNLFKADLSEAEMGLTIFGDVDLRTVKGLETVKHVLPSTIGTDTISRSEGNIPEMFLRQAGVTDLFITYAHSLARHPIEYYTCFISYSSKDQAFAERLYADLQSKGVRCWFAPEDMKIGDRIRPRIDESIRIYDKLLLVLSEHSVLSKWVGYEVEAALDKEQEGKPPVLFPVRLDKTVMESTTAWAAHIKYTRHIGDFTKWKDHDEYQKAFSRLLRDLKAEQKEMESKT